MRPAIITVAFLALPAAACLDTAGPEPGYYHGHAVIDLDGVETDQPLAAALLEVGGVDADLTLRLATPATDTEPALQLSEIFLDAHADTPSATLSTRLASELQLAPTAPVLVPSAAVVRQAGEDLEIVIAAETATGAGVRIELFAEPTY
jgi:hypothetical protein